MNQLSGRHSCAPWLTCTPMSIGQLIAALESGSTFSAVQALNISEGAFNEYSQVLTSVFLESGTATASLIAGSPRALLVCDSICKIPAAEKWIRQKCCNARSWFCARAG